MSRISLRSSAFIHASKIEGACLYRGIHLVFDSHFAMDSHVYILNLAIVDSGYNQLFLIELDRTFAPSLVKGAVLLGDITSDSTLELLVERALARQVQSVVFERVSRYEDTIEVCVKFDGDEDVYAATFNLPEVTSLLELVE